jgi:hypothetical protein
MKTKSTNLDSLLQELESANKKLKNILDEKEKSKDKDKSSSNQEANKIK